MRTCFLAVCITGLAVSTAGITCAEEKEEGRKPLTADEIVNRANLVAYYAGKDGRAEVRMATVAD